MDNPYHNDPNPIGSPAETILFLKEVKKQVEEGIGKKVYVTAGIAEIADRMEMTVKVYDEEGESIGGLGMTEEGILSAYDTGFVVRRLVIICQEALRA